MRGAPPSPPTALPHSLLQPWPTHIPPPSSYDLWLWAAPVVGWGGCEVQGVLGGPLPPPPHTHTWHSLSLQLSVRGKNRKELLGGFFRNIVKSADEALITGVSGLKVSQDPLHAVGGGGEQGQSVCLHQIPSPQKSMGPAQIPQ